jgi:4-oxalocrotonate tautomerase
VPTTDAGTGVAQIVQEIAVTCLFPSAVCVYHDGTSVWRTSHVEQGCEVPLLEVHLLAGRPEAAKAELVRELTAAVRRTLGSAPERIQVLIREYPQGHWNVAGEPLRLAGVSTHE